MSKIIKFKYQTNKLLSLCVLYSDLNRINNLILQESNIGFNLTAIFEFKNRKTWSSHLEQLNTFGNTNITGNLKNFQYVEFKMRLKLIKLFWIKFILITY